MTLNYIYSESGTMPLEVERNKNHVYLRKDIVETTRTDMEGNSTIMYTYQEAMLSEEEFASYSEETTVWNELTVNEVADRQDVMEEEILTIMEAIADLYSALAN